MTRNVYYCCYYSYYIIQYLDYITISVTNFFVHNNSYNYVMIHTMNLCIMLYNNYYYVTLRIFTFNIAEEVNIKNYSLY